uniref:F-box/kelch-repeat protein At3g23880-like n=1 Tax=Fragaria vesca subsp. vesca TaxID=101020 RepID=UPI0005CB5129|nr:PREDICTED: F-box/kelch-repeat protein At3g23880-like [Fragaria vesca subsp. vesca]
MHDIFSRLPPKSLCRFKCVSKPWRSMISDHVFVTKYNKDVSRRRRLMFTSVESTDHWLYCLDLNKFIYENHNDDVGGSTAAPSELDFVYNQLPYGGLDFVPSTHYSYHGLFFSHYCSGCFRFSLIDYETKESEYLPDAKIRRLTIEPGFDYWHLYGVGLFDYSTNGYKVIKGQQYNDGVVFSVYTWNPTCSGPRRKIEHLFPYRVLRSHGGHGILVNGEVHWLATKKVGQESLVMIISIILAEEKVREIAIPPNAPTGSIELGEFRDWLCITSAGYGTCNEFWVMKEYGVRESWTKMQSLYHITNYHILVSGRILMT